MLTEKQTDIFTAFVKYPFKERTRQEVKNLSKEKSNNALSIAFSQFMQEKLVVEKKVGKSSLYTLNFENNLAYYYIALSNDKRMKKPVKQALAYITEEIRKTTPFFSIALFGSYAINQEEKNSDLDIAILIEDQEKIKEIRRNLNTAELKSIPKLDMHIITRDDMLEMLTNNEENLGKQIAKKHMVIHNHQLFYDLLKEGIQHGFRI